MDEEQHRREMRELDDRLMDAIKRRGEIGMAERNALRRAGEKSFYAIIIILICSWILHSQGFLQ